MRIFIIGFMGAGKSYLGNKLAKQLNFDFVDLDEMIERKLSMPISRVFEQYGELGFRQIEADCLHGLAKNERVVVSTGGGAPCFFENMKWMNENGITIYFSASTDLLTRRLQPEKAHRPLLASLSDAELAQFIQTKLAERGPFYEQCHLQFAVPDEGYSGIEALSKYLIRFFK